MCEEKRHGKELLPHEVVKRPAEEDFSCGCSAGDIVCLLVTGFLTTRLDKDCWKAIIRLRREDRWQGDDVKE